MMEHPWLPMGVADRLPRPHGLPMGVADLAFRATYKLPIFSSPQETAIQFRYNDERDG